MDSKKIINKLEPENKSKLKADKSKPIENKSDKDHYMNALQINSAIKNGRVEEASQLIDKDREALFSQDVLGNTPLHYAAQSEKTAFVKKIIQTLEPHSEALKNNLEIKNYDDETPMDLAAENNSEIYEVLEKVAKTKAEMRAAAENVVEAEEAKQKSLAENKASVTYEDEAREFLSESQTIPDMMEEEFKELNHILNVQSIIDKDILIDMDKPSFYIKEIIKEFKEMYQEVQNIQKGRGFESKEEAINSFERIYKSELAHLNELDSEVGENVDKIVQAALQKISPSQDLEEQPRRGLA